MSACSAICAASSGRARKARSARAGWAGSAHPREARLRRSHVIFGERRVEHIEPFEERGHIGERHAGGLQLRGIEVQLVVRRRLVIIDELARRGKTGFSLRDDLFEVPRPPGGASTGGRVRREYQRFPLGRNFFVMNLKTPHLWSTREGAPS